MRLQPRKERERAEWIGLVPRPGKSTVASAYRGSEADQRCLRKRRTRPRRGRALQFGARSVTQDGARVEPNMNRLAKFPARRGTDAQRERDDERVNRASRVPTTNEVTGCRLGLTSFDPAPFCAAPIPNQKRSLSIAVSAIIGAALWWPYYAYDYGEFPYSASAKSPNPGQGCPERQRLER